MQMSSRQPKILMKCMEIVSHSSQWKNRILDVITKCPILVIYENGFGVVLKIENRLYPGSQSSEELTEQYLLCTK